MDQSNFITKDSGVREEFASGMKRDTQNGKPRYDLLDRAFLKRWAELMARGLKNMVRITGRRRLRRANYIDSRPLLVDIYFNGWKATFRKTMPQQWRLILRVRKWLKKSSVVKHI